MEDMQTGGVRVLIVDDQPLIRSGLRAVLGMEPDLTVVGEAADGAEAISFTRVHGPDVVLMDLHMPKISGLEATVQLLRMDCPPKVLVLTTFDTEDHVMQALSSGASGFLLKDTVSQELASAVRNVAAGGTALSSEVMRMLVAKACGGQTIAYPGVEAKLRSLTDSEHRVLRLLGKGFTNQQIAEHLHLSVSSVKTYVSRVLSRLHLDNRTQAAILAYEKGLLDEGSEEPGHTSV